MRTMECWKQIYARAHESVQYRLRTFAGGRWAARCRPASIALLITERCNARCVHCDIWKNKGGEDAPTVEQWKTVLADLRGWLGPVHVVLTGGEALLRPYTVELARFGTSIGLLLEILTHGYWRDPSRVEELARVDPWRITVSLHAIGAAHSRIRGREEFWDITSATLKLLKGLRERERLGYSVRLKTVLMEHNLDGAAEVARFAAQNRMEVFYQPIEENYNTKHDAAWFEHSGNWPKDAERAAAVVGELIRLKRAGLPIANSYPQLEVMIPYFRDPGVTQTAVQAHAAHERNPTCSALTGLQIQANGDVRVCARKGPIGNIREADVRELWERRPHLWECGCCMVEGQSRDSWYDGGRASERNL